MQISDAQLQNEQKLYKRLLLTKDDLNHAEAFAKALLDDGIQHESLRQALKTAMIVSYYRPFTDNEGSVDALRTLPTNKFLSNFDENNHATHAWIKNQRNTVMAHSDSSVYGINVSVSSVNDVKLAIPIKWNPWTHPSEARVKAIIDNIDKIKEKVTDEILRIQELLPVKGRF